MELDQSDTERLLRLLFMQADVIEALVAKRDTDSGELPSGMQLSEAIDDFERRIVKFYLTEFNGDIGRVADRIGRSRQHLHRLIMRYELTDHARVAAA